MKSWAIILFLQMTFVAAGTVEAADRSTDPNPVALMGGLDCAVWISARENKSSASAENYVQGLVNGFSWGRGMSIWNQKPVTREQFFFVDG